jgi:hypothetical protein
MSSKERVIRVKRVRVVADELIIEPDRIIIRRPEREEEVPIVRLRERY